MSKNTEMLIVTTPDIAVGRGQIDEVLGLVMAPSSNEAQAVKKLREAAEALGANAIVGFRLVIAADTENYAATAYGTAVKMSH